MEYSIGHIAYRTKDLEKTATFYTEILGFKRAFSRSDENGVPFMIYLMLPDGRFLELFSPKADAEHELGTSYLHLCLEVADCAAAMEDLQSKGIPITRALKRGIDTNWQCWIKDPDGRDIEIMQIVDTSEQYKNRRTL